MKGLSGIEVVISKLPFTCVQEEALQECVSESVSRLNREHSCG